MLEAPKEGGVGACALQLASLFISTALCAADTFVSAQTVGMNVGREHSRTASCSNEPHPVTDVGDQVCDDKVTDFHGCCEEQPLPSGDG
jgi:hypothetical protein